MSKQPLIIQYTNLLHEYRDPEAKAVKDFVKKHQKDEVFVKRAKKLNRLFQLKESLARELVEA